jgi:hypothetical protein
MVYLLAGGLAGVALLGMSPALAHLHAAVPPGWAQIILALTALQLVYVFWLLSMPDWSTEWIGMALCAGCAALYAGSMALVLTTPATKPIMLGLGTVRNTAGGWCALNVLLLGLLCYGFGKISARWRRRSLSPKRR